MGASNPKAKNRNSWRGSNLLGEILTEVREELSSTTSTITGASLCVKKQTVSPSSPQATVADEKFTFFFGRDSLYSQWHPSDFTVDGVEFNCAVQYQMYQKAGQLLSLAHAQRVGGIL